MLLYDNYEFIPILEFPNQILGRIGENSYQFLHMRFISLFPVIHFPLIFNNMTTYCEESDRIFVRNEIETILNKYRDSVQEDLLLKDIMNTSILLYQTKKVQ